MVLFVVRTLQAPAVNVKEDNEKYTMEVAVPGIKKEYVRISLDADGNLEPCH